MKKTNKKLLSLLICMSLIGSLFTVAMPTTAKKLDTPVYFGERPLTIMDAVHTLQHFAKSPFAPGLPETYDFNKDGKVEILDAVLALKGFAKVIDLTFPMYVYEWEEKSYSTATIDWEFCGQTVMVRLDKAVSIPHKLPPASFFGDFPIKEITGNLETKTFATEGQSVVIRLPRAENCTQPPPPIHLFGYERCVCELCKQNVLDVISILEKVDGIVRANVSVFRYFGI